MFSSVSFQRKDPFLQFKVLSIFKRFVRKEKSRVEYNDHRDLNSSEPGQEKEVEEKVKLQVLVWHERDWERK